LPDGREALLVPGLVDSVTGFLKGHGLSAGQRVYLNTPGQLSYTGNFLINSVDSETFTFEAVNFKTGAPQGVNIRICVSDCAGPRALFVSSQAYHDGVETVYARYLGPGGTGSVLRIEGSADAYSDNFTIRRISPEWITFTVPYASVREQLDTAYLPDQLYLGSGDDKLVVGGGEDRMVNVFDRAGGLDTLTIANHLDPIQIVVPNLVNNRGLVVNYQGIDQVNFYDPTVNLTLHGATATTPIVMGPIGVGAAGLSVTVPVDVTARTFEVESRATFLIDTVIDADAYTFRIFGDNQSLTIPYPLAGPDGVHLAVADGTLTLPAGTQISAGTASIKAKQIVAPGNRINLSVDTLTFVTSPQATNILEVYNDRDLRTSTIRFALTKVWAPFSRASLGLQARRRIGKHICRTPIPTLTRSPTMALRRSFCPEWTKRPETKIPCAFSAAFVPMVATSG